MSEPLKHFSKADVLHFRNFFSNFLARFKEKIIIENYTFYIFVCPYNGNSGMWSVRLDTSAKELTCYHPENSLKTRIDAESIFALMREGGAEVKGYDDFVWKVNIFPSISR